MFSLLWIVFSLKRILDFSWQQALVFRLTQEFDVQDYVVMIWKLLSAIA